MQLAIRLSSDIKIEGLSAFGLVAPQVRSFLLVCRQVNTMVDKSRGKFS
jgi:hypothetical protein